VPIRVWQPVLQIPIPKIRSNNQRIIRRKPRTRKVPPTASNSFPIRPLQIYNLASLRPDVVNASPKPEARSILKFDMPPLSLSITNRNGSSDQTLPIEVLRPANSGGIPPSQTNSSGSANLIGSQQSGAQLALRVAKLCGRMRYLFGSGNRHYARLFLEPPNLDDQDLVMHCFSKRTAPCV
jgi:hypothetical protein